MEKIFVTVVVVISILIRSIHSIRVSPFTRKVRNLIQNMSREKKWFPLESNPALMNKYIESLGFDTTQYSFMDVFSTEDWALEMIPSGSVAVVFLYPINHVQEKHRESEKPSQDEAVWFLRQNISNACG